MSHYRDGHWRTSVNGNYHWVEGHSVDRSDWSKGPQGGFRTPELPRKLGNWGAYEGGRLDSYTIPNARCPVCRDPVIFYQSECGGRVFFDPPLGPPWDKHPCTDNQSTLSTSPRERPQDQGVEQRFKRHDFDLTENQQVAVESGMLAKSKAPRWHPLLEIKLRTLGKWQHIEGFDPIDRHRCSLFTLAVFNEVAPTYIRVIEPQRIVCEIEQPSVDENDKIQIIFGKGWFGVDSLEKVRIAKSATTGDVLAMQSYGRNRSYRYLGGGNKVSDVSDFIDLRAAFYWLQRAGNSQVLEAHFEHAYLQDLVADSVATTATRTPHSTITSDIGQSSGGLKATYVQAVGREAREHMKLTSTMQHMRNVTGSNDGDIFLRKRLANSGRRLMEMAEHPSMPHLSDAIRRFISNGNSSVK